eukprot:evm.model.scf_691.3 EVM.evm.TU.scf_691.3   scf_691:18481-19188(-)
MEGFGCVDEALKRIRSHKGVLGVMIINARGVPLRTTLDAALTTQYAALLSHFTSKARCALKQLEPNEDLNFLRIRSKRHEILVAPDYQRSDEYSLIIVQDPK